MNLVSLLPKTSLLKTRACTRNSVVYNPDKNLMQDPMLRRMVKPYHAEDQTDIVVQVVM